MTSAVRRYLDAICRSRQHARCKAKDVAVANFMRRLHGAIRWRPDATVRYGANRTTAAFTNLHNATTFPAVLAVQARLAQKESSFECWLVVQQESAIQEFTAECRKSGFGLILEMGRRCIVALDAGSVATRSVHIHTSGHYPRWLIDRLKPALPRLPKFGVLLAKFAQKYAAAQDAASLSADTEEKLTKEAVKRLLSSDSRFCQSTKPADVLRAFERGKDDVRDHYFHAFGIFLLGLWIINRYHADFVNYARSAYPGDATFSVEYAWFLTAFFHDVGYPATRIVNFAEDAVGIPLADALESVTSSVWSNEAYKQNLKHVCSLLRYLSHGSLPGSGWQPDVFHIQESEMEPVFRDSYADCHGVAGCFRLLVEFFKEAASEPRGDTRTFWVRHMYPAALSIALHDRRFRDRLARIGIGQVRLSRFPFAALLSYLDAVHEDHRVTGSSPSEEELLLGFDFNGVVIARVDDAIARAHPRIGNIRQECADFGRFVVCDGIKFHYPKVLVA